MDYIFIKATVLPRKKCSHSSALQKIKKKTKTKENLMVISATGHCVKCNTVNTLWNIYSLVIPSGETFCSFPTITLSCSAGKKFVSKLEKKIPFIGQTGPKCMMNISFYLPASLTYFCFGNRYCNITHDGRELLNKNNGLRVQCFDLNNSAQCFHP